MSEDEPRGDNNSGDAQEPCQKIFHNRIPPAAFQAIQRPLLPCGNPSCPCENPWVNALNQAWYFSLHCRRSPRNPGTTIALNAAEGRTIV
jgi:hypothetical protein